MTITSTETMKHKRRDWMKAVIEVRDLTKRYGNITAVDSVSFDIEKGEIFGLLGPNGAGKTTTIEMIEGLRKPDSGIVRICGLDVSKKSDGVKELIGVQLQSTTIYEKIRVDEAIDLFGGYYKKPLPTAAVLENVSLSGKRHSFAEALSGGQRQRLAMALAMVNDPEVLFLDEPTTGLDPQARRNVWDIIEKLKERGKTVVLTTHYMEEAERLCDRVGIMDLGKIIALDTPDGLIAKQDMESAVELVTHNGSMGEILGKIAPENKVTYEGNTCVVHTKKASSVLVELVRMSESNGINLENISVRRATLEDVFLELTGKKLRE
jgi:ABC-2 type transport system ATP-binding protein